MAKYEGRSLKLSPEAWRFLEDRVAEFESAWSRGERPQIGEYRPTEATDPTGGRLLLELVHTELEFRIEAGEPARVEEYIDRFPELGERVGAIADLAAAEVRLRRPFEPRLGRAEYGRRFPTLVGRIATALESAETIVDGAVRAQLAAEIMSDGTRVPGFELVRVLGRGGMGVVYEARDLSLDRKVAVKTLRPGAEPNDRLRLRKEAEAAARLQHAHVVEVHRTVSHAGRLYIVTEYLTGGTLADRIKQGPLPMEEAALLLEKVARAVAYAHENGIIHRDLKPANILFAGDGTPKVADFGLAKRLDEAAELTRTGIIAGSPAYMAPEQAAGDKTVGPSTDVWSLGVILYEALTGRLPFRGGTVLESLEQVRSASPAPIRKFLVGPRAKVSDLETVCLKCLEKRPADRYASAAALAEDLARFRRAEPVTARPIGLVERCRRWTVQNVAVTALLILLFIALAGGTVASLLFALEAVKSERQSRRLLFASDMRQAADAILEGDPVRAAGLIDPHRGERDADCRFVLNHLSRIVRVPHTPIDHLGGAAYVVRISPDGETLAACGLRGEIRFFKVGTWNPLGRIAASQGELNGLAFTADGKHLVSAGDDGTVVLWDLATQTPVWRQRVFEKQAYEVELGLNDTVLAVSGDDPVIRLLDAKTGEHLNDLKHHKKDVQSIAVTPDGETLLSAGDDGLAVGWNLSTSKRRWKINEGHTEIPRLMSVSVSPDGQRAVFGSSVSSVLVVDTDNGRVLNRDGIETKRGSSRDGVTFRTVDYPSIGPGDEFIIAADGGAVFHCGLDGKKVRPSLRHPRPAWWTGVERIRSAVLLPDGTVVTASDDGAVIAWQPTQAAAWRQVTLESLAWDTDWLAPSDLEPRLVAACADGLRLIDPETGRSELFAVPLGAGCAVSVSIDGRLIVAAAKDGRMWGYAVDDGGRPHLCWRRPSANGFDVALGPISARADVVPCITKLGPTLEAGYELQLVDVRTGDTLRERRLDAAWAPVCLPDGREIAVLENNSIRVHDSKTLAPTRRYETGKMEAKAFAYSPDGSLLAAAGGDQQVTIWDVRQDKIIRRWTAETAKIRTLAFSPSGNALLISTEDHAPRLWDLTTGSLLQEPGSVPVSAQGRHRSSSPAFFTPDGGRCVFGHGKLVTICDGRP